MNWLVWFQIRKNNSMISYFFLWLPSLKTVELSRVGPTEKSYQKEKKGKEQKVSIKKVFAIAPIFFFLGFRSRRQWFPFCSFLFATFCCHSATERFHIVNTRIFSSRHRYSELTNELCQRKDFSLRLTIDYRVFPNPQDFWIFIFL